jgi:hypothetical protein
MQKAAGTEIGDLTRSVFLSASNAPAEVGRRRLRLQLLSAGRYAIRCASSPSASFLCGQAASPKVIRTPVGRRAGNTRDRDCSAMPFGYACVCHSRFQNEVMDG